MAGGKRVFQEPRATVLRPKWFSFLFFTWQLSDPLKILPGKRLCAILVNSVGSRELKCEFKFCLTSCVALR